MRVPPPQSLNVLRESTVTTNAGKGAFLVAEELLNSLTDQFDIERLIKAMFVNEQLLKVFEGDIESRRRYRPDTTFHTMGGNDQVVETQSISQDATIKKMKEGSIGTPVDAPSEYVSRNW